MRRLIILIVLVSNSALTYSQIKIFYDENCDITMEELATHYRVAYPDTLAKGFKGEVNDYWINDSSKVKLNYNSKGLKDWLIEILKPTGEIKLQGQYSNGDKIGTWSVFEREILAVDYSKKTKPVKTVDSIEVCLKRKEDFQVSRFIRRKDYPEIYTLISKPRTNFNSNGTWTVVEERPYFPNGMEALGQFIGAFLKYPDEAVKNNIKGQVIVEFTIAEDGSTTDFKVLKGIGYGCDEEAIRVLKLLPDWVPGYQRGKAVRTKFKLPLKFG